MSASYPHAAAFSYLSSVPRSTRREAGQVYTPTSLVEFILDLSEYLPEKPLEEWRVLDPACGAGAFLVGAINRLATRVMANGTDPTTPTGHQRLLDTIELRIFGIDKDPQACSLALEAAHFLTWQICGRKAPASFFEANIVEEDFLLGDAGTITRGGFELIVGNPPYVATNRLPDKQKNQLRARFIAANGRLDLYTLFFERSLRLLSKGGRLAFITPNKFLISESARRLRKLILTTASLRTIANFRSHRVFEDAATVPCVTVLERGAPEESIKLLECTVAPGGREPVAIQTRTTAKHPKGGEQPWFLAEPGLLELAQKIQGNHQPLGRLSTRISAGIATGRDRIFVIRSDVGKDLEPELRRPAIRGQDLLPFCAQNPKLEIIIPYRPTTNGRPELVDLNEFPRTKEYLEGFRQELEDRHCIRKWQKVWYDIHDPWTMDITGLTKILVPDVACSNRFVLDSGTYCPLHSAYYIIPSGVDPRYLIAVLNSSPVEFLVRLLAPVVKDGFSRYRRQFLITLPIPEASGRTQADIISAVAAEDFVKSDVLCCKLFGLTSGESRTIQQFLKRIRTVHGKPGNPSTARTSKHCQKTQS